MSFAAILSVYGLAHAAGDGRPLPWSDLFYRIATVVLVVGTIWKLAGKKLAAALSGRREGIARELDALEERKEKARRSLMDVERRIAGLERERAAILAEYEARGEALKAEIIAGAEESARQIIAQARQTARNEIDQAIAAMREELADKIVAAAGESIAGSLSAKDHQKLLSAFLNKVVLQ